MREPDFTESEFAVRTSRAQQLMHANTLDALLFTTEAEFRYFTGFRTLFWQSPTRPWFLVLPKTGKPVAVIPQIGAHLIGTTWVDDIRTFSAPSLEDEGITELTAALAEHRRIGMPMGRESSLRMPLTVFERLRKALPLAEFVDASPLVQNLRQSKSDAEIAYIRDICAIASKSFARASNLFQEGQSLKDAFRAFRIDLLQGGADDVPYLVGAAEPEGYLDVISPPTDKPLAAGDVLMLDTGAVKNGYFCDFDRNFAVGSASDAVKTTHSKLIRAVDAAAAVARPGRTCADLFLAMTEVLGQTDGDVGRLGHGLGIQLTETPSITSFDQTQLRENMVMTLEPSLTLSNGRMMVHEENIVIRDGPPEFLSVRAAQDIVII